MGKSNQAANTLCHHPKTNSENFTDSKSDMYETILYAVVCDDLSEVIKGEKSPLDVKEKFKEI